MRAPACTYKAAYASGRGFSAASVWLACCLWGLGLEAKAAASAPEAQLTQFGSVPPELTGRLWLNVPRGTALSLRSLRGRVTVVHFWTFDCVNCRHNLPYYAQWQKQFGSRGLEIIGIHTPETAAEHNVTNVVSKVKDLGITYPVLIDEFALNWNAWGQRCWPTVYLIDKKGRARFIWEGELEYQGRGGSSKLTAMIETLLEEKP